MTRAPRRGPYVCGLDAAMDVVSGKWKVLILWELEHHGIRRFAELRRGLTGVSEKMLTQHLREMEQDGLIHREVHPEVPPRVEYSLTEHGIALNRALEPLGFWGRDRLRREGISTVEREGVVERRCTAAS
ncbi:MULTISPECIES: winged helix-turn-helix transcriptional regulator [Nocardiopsis]|jgi:DNA-binding HxlR family transcriptional regulator|uniref:Helix-turn-helix domain-containing protein n=2 Tax=Nocardiopsis alba TaxID=53437 RepID=A0A7K2IVQ2_9ACTN|nr:MULTISPECIES: helix-turn-helix domain-containing protein [Nocardiopsis]AFR09428.1 hxlR-like helix-turn-helix family protein [Nocardiopsis alba ATCC BAA-2165]MEC3894254.1 helix-turn-helix domain-containing protein [Nocardiopsis sp. LDBS1602]MYR34042.1 transcriptional regulator [Nocardiopsis alba]